MGHWKWEHQGCLIKPPATSLDSIVANDVNKHLHTENDNTIEQIVCHMSNLLD